MNLSIQFKIKNNANYLKYIRENSDWYKVLTRTPSSFKNFEDTVKEAYHLGTTHRISKAIETFEMLQTLVSAIK